MTCPVAPAVRPSSSFILSGRLWAVDAAWLLELLLLLVALLQLSRPAEWVLLAAAART
jgi:hypothetical protein